MADDEPANGTKLTWWILGICASVAVLLVSLTISKFETFDRRLREVEILQGEGKEHVRQLHELIARIRVDQTETVTKLGTINIQLTALDLGIKAMAEQQALLHRLLDQESGKERRE